MAGYFTQSRQRPVVSYKEQYGAAVTSKDFSVTQTTFSFRSSRPADAKEQSYSELLKPLEWSPFGTGDRGHEFNSRNIAVSFGNRGTYSPNTGTTLTPTSRFSTVWNRSISSGPITKAEYYFLDDEPEKQLFAPPMPSNDIIFYGKKAIAATAPTRPEASFSTFAAEFMRDGLPSLMLSSIGSGRFQGIVSEARKVSQDYLNVTFGWTPLMNDLSRLLHSVLESYKIIEQYKRDSGRVVRRRHTFPTTVTQELVEPKSYAKRGIISVYGGSSKGYDPLAWQYDQCVSTVQLTTQQKVWFAGAYQYYLPEGDKIFDRLARYASYAEHLLGLKLTPEVLWNAAPWSWLLDWFADIGTTLEIQSSLQQDDLVIKYGYLMRETSKRFLFSIPGGRAYQLPAPPLSSVITGITKERYRATPYGFGLDPDSFSFQRVAIIGAIATGNRRGVSK